MRPYVNTLAAAMCMLLSACRQDMHDQPRFETLEQSDFFVDGRSARPIPRGTVPRGSLQPLLISRDAGGNAVTELPMPLTATLLERGRKRYDIYCTPCHGRLGDGQGIVARRGFRIPASFHSDRLRGAPPGYLYEVITYGFGAMADYATELAPPDRWAVVAYVRVLQLSQHAPLDRVPREELSNLESEVRSQ